MDNKETSLQILEEFLSYPLNTADDIFQRFEGIPGAISGRGASPLQRYVCIPGSRENKVVLIAHADTVWDDAYGRPGANTVCFEDGRFKGTNPNCGIGADDRAGCAMLWALRDSGHTILVVNGEEKGKHGAKFLKRSNPGLFRMLNRHQMMIELDTGGTGRCKCNQANNTKAFCAYITEALGFKDDPTPGSTDLYVLCQKICGVNVGVGYHRWHTPEEFLDFAEWENTYAGLTRFLELEHPKFRIGIVKRTWSFVMKVKNKLCRMLKLSK